jgi:ABC-type amino acid transport substrate-binding protein
MSQFGVKDAKKTYPGWGTLSSWYHCSTGTRNTGARQRTTAFSHPYTNPASDKSGFVVPAAAASKYPTDTAVEGYLKGKKVGVLNAQGFTQPFVDKFGSTMTVVRADTMPPLWAQLKAGTVDAVFTGLLEHKKFANESVVNAAHKIMNLQAFSKGISFACRPEFGDALAIVNSGLGKVKADTAKWKALCAKYPNVECDVAASKYNNALPDSPHSQKKGRDCLDD